MSFVPSFGRWEDPAHTEAFFASQTPLNISGAALLSGVDDDADVDLCALYESVSQTRWNSRNQNPRGFCVGFGNAKMTSLVIAMMAVAGEITWPGADAAIEPIYGGSRYEIGAKKHGSNINRGGDGGVGSWAAEWLLEYGVLLEKKHDDVDLSTYSLERCDLYGRVGVPDQIEDNAKLHPLQTMQLATDAETCWKLIGGLHPLVHCSNQGFDMKRMADGICRAMGSWAHCAGWSGRFTLKNGTRVLRYDNSWEGRADGSGYLGTPITIEGKNGPIHLNGNQFLVPLEVVDRMCKAGRETYGMTGPLGFNKRQPLMMP